MNNRSNQGKVSKIFNVEGNIGSGKSTLLKLIGQKIKNVQVIKEPVNQWQSISGNPQLNLLESFYQDPQRWAYTFQSYAYYSRLKQWSEIEFNQPLVVAERSVLSDKHIFAENGKKAGFFTELEWALYLEYFNWLTAQFNADKIDGIIYLQTDPEICSKRINIRGRSEEKNSIQLEYLRSIHDRHEEWLTNKENLRYPVLIISGDEDFEKDNERQQDILQEVDAFIKQQL